MSSSTSEVLHFTASTGFQAEADAYAKARPSYPAESIEYIHNLLLANSNNPEKPTASDFQILDLGAGTGIMTQLLYQKGYQVTAVEPVDAMREKLSTSLPLVTTFKGTAWSIPVQSNSFDLVMLAQCFHWFDDIQSLREIHRVLKPGGIIILIWNMESQERSQWVIKLRELYQAFDSTAPQYRYGHWKNVFETDEAKQMYKLPLEHEQFVYDTQAKRGDVWTRITSKSYIAVLDKQEQDTLKEKVEQVLDDPQYSLPTKGDDQTVFIYPHDTDMYWCYKK